MEKKNLNSIIKKSTGFTLAEVLITLGIIGVVAAMTIPTLISNTNSQKFRSQYKKSLSTLNQAVRLNQAQYDWNFSDIKTPCSKTSRDTSNPENTISFCAMMNGSLAGARWTTVSDLYGSSFKFLDQIKEDFVVVYVLADGSAIFPSVTMQDMDGSSGGTEAIETKSYLDSSASSSLAFIDVNGAASPNKETKCTDGTVKYIGDSSYSECTVDKKSIGDIFPVWMHGSTVEPASNAARATLYTAK